MKTETIYGTIPAKSNCYTVGRVNGRPCIVKSNEMKRYERSFIKQCTSTRTGTYPLRSGSLLMFTIRIIRTTWITP